ncbi:MAG: disulfide bond formation protein B [Hyphomicrobium sp.]
MSAKAAVTLNALALYAVSGILLVAFYWQLANGELPCPLCLLQRVAFAALAVGPALSVRHGPKPKYMGLVVIAALVGAGIAGRQILIHIMPGDAGYGSTLLGLHFYTWAFIAFAGALLAAGVMLTLGPSAPAGDRRPVRGLFEDAAVWLTFALVALNAFSALAQCGFSGCPANPVHYELLG